MSGSSRYRKYMPAVSVRLMRRAEGPRWDDTTRWAVTVPENVDRDELIAALEHRFPWFTVNPMSEAGEVLNVR